MVSFLISVNEKFICNIKHRNILFNMNYLCFLSLLIVLLQTKGIMKQMLLRMNSYILFIYIIFIPAIINTLRDNKKLFQLLNIFIYISIFCYLIRTICFNGIKDNLVPYSMNFQLFN